MIKEAAKSLVTKAVYEPAFMVTVTYVIPYVPTHSPAQTHTPSSAYLLCTFLSPLCFSLVLLLCSSHVEAFNMIPHPPTCSAFFLTSFDGNFIEPSAASPFPFTSYAKRTSPLLRLQAPGSRACRSAQSGRVSNILLVLDK